MASVEAEKEWIRVRGIVFADLGHARDFMSLEWVRDAMRERLGFDPYPGTLNLHLRDNEALAHWQAVKERVPPVFMPSPDPSFCSSYYFLGFLTGWRGSEGLRERIAIVVPGVDDYPADKVEVIARLALKDTYSIRDGDELVLVFECDEKG